MRAIARQHQRVGVSIEVGQLPTGLELENPSHFPGPAADRSTCNHSFYTVAKFTTALLYHIFNNYYCVSVSIIISAMIILLVDAMGTEGTGTDRYSVLFLK